MIARKKKLFGICLVMIFISCHESQTKALSQDDWQKISLTPHNSKLIEGAMPLVLQKDYIICLGQNQNNGSVIFKIDLATGKKLWENFDVRGDSGESLFIRETPHVFANIIHIQDNARYYQVDLLTGKTLSKKSLDAPTVRGAGGIGKHYFYQLYDRKNVTRFYENIIGGKEEILLWTAPEKENCGAGMYFPISYINTKKDTLIMIPYGYYNKKNYEAEDNFALYNVTKQRIVYTQNITVFSRLSGGFRGIAIYKDYVYFATGFYFACHRLKDGKQIWRKEIPMNIGSIAVADGRFIGSANNGVLYCFDAFTGKELWQRGGISSNNPPLYMNGVFYATNFYLYAVDAKTGALLWQKESPDNRENSQSGFISNVVGTNGKIYVSSFLNLYCFKAAR